MVMTDRELDDIRARIQRTTEDTESLLAEVSRLRKQLIVAESMVPKPTGKRFEQRAAELADKMAECAWGRDYSFDRDDAYEACLAALTAVRDEILANAYQAYAANEVTRKDAPPLPKPEEPR